MLLDLGDLQVRSWRKSDLDALLRHANNAKIAANLRDQFPHPYTRRDAVDYLNFVRDQRPERAFAMQHKEEAIGGLGFQIGLDISRVSAEIGYWIGEAYWGRGFATRAVIAVTGMGILRIQAHPRIRAGLCVQRASIRVLEKAGFQREGVLRRSAVKNGVILDQVIFAKIGEARCAVPRSQSVSITRYLVTPVTRASIRHHRPMSVSRRKITPTTAQVRREAPVFVPLCRARSADLRRDSGAGIKIPDCACSEASGEPDHSPLPQRFPPLVMPLAASPVQQRLLRSARSCQSVQELGCKHKGRAGRRKSSPLPKVVGFWQISNCCRKRRMLWFSPPSEGRN